MKYLIVNADDFGYSYGINKGIIEAHTNGVVTSTSVMVDAIACDEASSLVKYDKLSVGLHFVLNETNIQEELDRQVKIFVSLVGRKPDHIDTHKMEPSVKEAVKNVLLDYSKENHTPIRSLGFAKLIKTFFGLNIDGSGVLDEKNVSVGSLKKAIDSATEAYNEIMCHPGYSDDYLRQHSSYNDVRQKELESLVNPEIKEYLESKKDIKLCSWQQVKV